MPGRRVPGPREPGAAGRNRRRRRGSAAQRAAAGDHRRAHLRPAERHRRAVAVAGDGAGRPARGTLRRLRTAAGRSARRLPGAREPVDVAGAAHRRPLRRQRARRAGAAVDVRPHRSRRLRLRAGPVHEPRLDRDRRLRRLDADRGQPVLPGVGGHHSPDHPHRRGHAHRDRLPAARAVPRLPRAGPGLDDDRRARLRCARGRDPGSGRGGRTRRPDGGGDRADQHDEGAGRLVRLGGVRGRAGVGRAPARRRLRGDGGLDVGLPDRLDHLRGHRPARRGVAGRRPAAGVRRSHGARSHGARSHGARPTAPELAEREPA